MPAASCGKITERTEAGLSQAQLAQVVGMNRQTICCIEAGGYNPTLNLRIAICKTLGKTPDDLIWIEWRTTMSPLKKLFASGPKDECLTAVAAPAYKAGFHILAFGIMFDLWARFNYLAQTDVAGNVVQQASRVRGPRLGSRRGLRDSGEKRHLQRLAALHRGPHAKKDRWGLRFSRLRQKEGFLLHEAYLRAGASCPARVSPCGPSPYSPSQPAPLPWASTISR